MATANAPAQKLSSSLSVPVSDILGEVLWDFAEEERHAGKKFDAGKKKPGEPGFDHFVSLA
ncbi:hypothetical protein HED52_07450 [Ochrobactrum ciceri]|uniref:Uncharacterized protein n=1 Tax=Brucella ciceri TaxID=391287 RepID=A0ABX1DT65_9HYPH|nr:hypothetical protein [Brucella ciceri]